MRLLTTFKERFNNVLSPLGLSLTKNPGYNEILELLRLMQPLDLGQKLIRVGGQADGGYLVPDCLNGIEICFSPGVGKVATFEREVTSRGLTSYLADASVDSLPEALENTKFIKKYVKAYDSENSIEINRWIGENMTSRKEQDFLLQMDIEGDEYPALLAISNDNLRRARIMVIEFHRLGDLRNREFYRMVFATFSKLLSTHEIAHVHANNGKLANRIRGLYVPEVAEFTFLRKDFVKQKNRITKLPHLLDQRNCPNKRDVIFPLIS